MRFFSLPFVRLKKNKQWQRENKKLSIINQMEKKELNNFNKLNNNNNNMNSCVLLCTSPFNFE